jgi:DNA polymerase III subunit epsilon
MKDFAAIDFEIANNSRSSVCSVEIVIVRDGQVVESAYRIYNMKYPNYDFFCTEESPSCFGRC